MTFGKRRNHTNMLIGGMFWLFCLGIINFLSSSWYSYNQAFQVRPLIRNKSQNIVWYLCISNIHRPRKCLCCIVLTLESVKIRRAKISASEIRDTVLCVRISFQYKCRAKANHNRFHASTSVLGSRGEGELLLWIVYSQYNLIGLPFLD